MQLEPAKQERTVPLSECSQWGFKKIQMQSPQLAKHLQLNIQEAQQHALEHLQSEFQFSELRPTISVKVPTFWNLYSINFSTNGTSIWNPNKIFIMEPT